jgi:hypothetical protein
MNGRLLASRVDVTSGIRRRMMETCRMKAG